MKFRGLLCVYIVEIANTQLYSRYLYEDGDDKNNSDVLFVNFNEFKVISTVVYCMHCVKMCIVLKITPEILKLLPLYYERVNEPPSNEFLKLP